LLLAAAPQPWFSGERVTLRMRLAVQWLSRVSYSVFLIHYPVSLVVSAVVTAYWPEALTANAMGMAVSVLMSVWAGHGLNRLTERQPQNFRHLFVWSLIFMASVALAMRGS
jgi:peptidoglycan/LPS O-acetylase OafA/YrhL